MRMPMLFAGALASTLTLFSGSAWSATLTGSVLDPSSRPVLRAEVSLFPRDQIDPMRVLSDNAGAYRFENLLPGQYVLQVQAPGFARYKSTIVAVEPNDTFKLDVSLPLASQ